jgi:hypothetical protein
MENVPEQLWNAYLNNKHVIKPDGEELKRLRQAFFHGLYCGHEQTIKATNLPNDRLVEFMRNFRNAIHAGLTNTGNKIIQTIKNN